MGSSSDILEALSRSHFFLLAMQLLGLSAIVAIAAAKVIDFEADAGGIPDQDDSDTWWTNGQALNTTLGNLQPGDTLVIPNKTYHIMGGIRADNVKGVTIQIDGTFAYATDTK